MKIRFIAKGKGEPDNNIPDYHQTIDFTTLYEDYNLSEDETFNSFKKDLAKLIKHYFLDNKGDICEVFTTIEIRD